MLRSFSVGANLVFALLLYLPSYEVSIRSGERAEYKIRPYGKLSVPKLEKGVGGIFDGTIYTSPKPKIPITRLLL